MKRKNFHRPPGSLCMAMLLYVIASLTGLQTMAQSNTDAVTIQQILDAHNAYRRAVGIRGLSWSDDLAQYAQRWADELATNRGCVLQHRPHNPNDPWNERYGENIFAGGGVGWNPTILDAVATWGTEKKNFNAKTKTCRNNKCGHYTQLVWKNSTQVGCGIATCANGIVIVVCNYNPMGNFVGQKPY